MNKKIIIDAGLTLELMKNNFTAKVICSPRVGNSVLIPRSIVYQSQEYLITTIGAGSFENNKTIKKIRFPEDSALLSIEKNSFKYSSIESIEIPGSVTELQDGWCKGTFDLNCIIISPNNRLFKYADDDHQIVIGKSDKIESYDVLLFGSRNIKKVTIPDYIKIISPYAFQSCDLETVNISENSELQKIGLHSFGETKIQNFFIPSKVETIEYGVFSTTCQIDHISISPKNRFFKYADIEQKMIVGKSDKNNDDYDVLVYGKKDIEIAKIPSNIKRIDSYAFLNCERLKTVEIPENSQLQSIGKNAFFDSDIKSIYIPSSVHTLEEGFLYSTTELENIIISPHNQHFKYLDDGHHIIVGKSDNSSENYDVIVAAFGDIEKVKIPAYIKGINSNAFENCHKLKTVEFEENSKLQRIGKRAFNFTQIQTFKIPKSVEIIGKECFSFCENLQKVRIEKGTKLRTISYGLFSFCSELKTVEIPEESEIKTIEEEAFSSSAINSLYIPSSVEVLKDKWCCSLRKLKQVSISSKNKFFCFADKEKSIIVSKSDKDNENFDVLNFACRNITIANIPDSIEYISSYAFYWCRKLGKIHISENSKLISIGENAFDFCQFSSIFFPKNFQILAEDWNKSFQLKRINISPDNPYFKYIDYNKQIIIGKSDTKVDSYDVIVFGDRNIQSVQIPDNIKIISSCAFCNCSGLKTVEFSEYSQLQKIGKNAFDSTNIEKFIVPKNVEIICEDCFANCKNLKTFEFHEDSKIEVIEQNTFEYSSIEYLFIPASVLFLKDEWCAKMKHLKSISISQENPKYKYLDNKQQLIVCKSNSNNINFDVIVFANRNIQKVLIPSYIKYINSCAFNNCKKLTSVSIPENSELLSFGNYSFQSSSIKSLIIPKNVNTIDFWAFNDCFSLESIEFLSESIISNLDFRLINLKIISFPNMKKFVFQNGSICQTSIITLSAGSEIKLKDD